MLATRWIPRWGPAFLSALVLFIAPQGLNAANVTVSPVRLLMVNGKDTVTMNVKNIFDRPTLFHLEPQVWTQEGGKDRTEPTTEIIAMPPIFRIEPGKTQVVRVALRRGRDKQRELTYRLFVTEVLDETAPQSEGIRSNLRISVPIFIRPEQKARPAVEFSAELTGGAKLRLTANNLGKAHILIGRLMLFRQGNDTAPFHDSALSGYILAGKSRSWVLDLAVPLGSDMIVLKAETDDGNREATLTVQSP